MAAPDGAAMFASCWDAEDVTGPHTVGRRFCNLRAFWPQAKTSAQAEFSSAEHLNLLRVEAAFGRRNPKRNTSLSAGVSFCLVRKV